METLKATFWKIVSTLDFGNAMQSMWFCDINQKLPQKKIQ